MMLPAIHAPIASIRNVSLLRYGDGSVAEDLIADLLEQSDLAAAQAGDAAQAEPLPAQAEPPGGQAEQAGDVGPAGAEPPADRAGDPDAEAEGKDAVYGDAAYGSGSFQDRLEKAGLRSGCKTQPPPARRGRFSKDCFGVNLTDDTVTCPAGRTVAIRRAADGTGTASFAPHCATCPLRQQCTDSAEGRTVQVGVFEDALARARARQADSNWLGDYRATRPKVERKLAHLMDPVGLLRDARGRPPARWS